MFSVGLKSQFIFNLVKVCLIELIYFLNIVSKTATTFSGPEATDPPKIKLELKHIVIELIEVLFYHRFILRREL